MKCYGLHKGFSQFGVSLFNMHDVWTPPAPVVKFAPGVLEGPAFTGHPGGLWLTHKASSKVRFDGGPAIQQGHDAGYLIPHIPPIAAVPNLMLFIHMAVSKHKIMFPATQVLIEGKPMGMYAGKFLGSVCSNPVSLPTGYLCKHSGTVEHDMTLEDFILGMALLLVDLVLDILWSKIMKGDAWRGANKLISSDVIRKASKLWWVTGKLGDRIPALRAMAAKIAAQGVSRTPPWKNVLNGIFNDKMIKSRLNLFSRNLGSKWLDHFVKSWGASPLTAGLLFQGVATFTGTPRSSLPSIALGRAGLHVSFFSKGEIVSFHQNVNN